MEKKTIYILRHYASPPNLAGSTRHHYIAKMIVNDGHKAYIFSSAYNHLLRKKVKNPKAYYEIESCDEINYIWLKGIPYFKNGLKRIFGMIHYAILSFKAALNLEHSYKIQPNIVIGSIAHSFAALSAFFIAKRYEAKFWLDIGDLWPEGLIQAGTLSTKHPLTFFLKKISHFLYTRADFIIVLNENTKKYFVDRKIDKKRIILFPPGGFFKAPYKENNQKRESEFRIVYSGSLSRLYPLDEAIKAIAKLKDKVSKDLILEIVGNGPEKDAYKEVATKNCPENVIFTDVQPKKNLYKIYQNADALLVIEKNVSYGFPNKLIDYFSSAKPIIIAAENHYKTDKNMVVATLPDAEHLSVSILELLNMSKYQKSLLGRNAYTFGLKNFDIRSNYRKLLSRLI